MFCHLDPANAVEKSYYSDKANRFLLASLIEMTNTCYFVTRYLQPSTHHALRVTRHVFSPLP